MPDIYDLEAHAFEEQNAEQNTDVYDVVSDSQLITTEFPQAAWQVERLIPKEQITVISGPPSSYKSMVTLDMAIRMVRGEKAFQHFETTQANVLIVNEDGDHQRQFKKRRKALSDYDALDGLYYMINAGFKDEAQATTRLLRTAQKLSIHVIVLDSLRAILPRGEDEMNSGDMRNAINNLRLLTKAGITVILIHHDRKRPTHIKNYSSTDPLELGEMMSGSVDIRGATDCHIAVVSKAEGLTEYIVMTQTKNREDALLPAFKIMVTKYPKEEKIALSYGDEFTPDMNAIFKATEAIKDILQQATTPLSTRDIIDMKPAGFGERTARAALTNLKLDEAVVVRTGKELQQWGISVDNTQSHYYSLPKEKNGQNESNMPF